MSSYMSSYYAVLDGQVEGPFAMPTLESMLLNGTVGPQTQVCSAENPEQWMTWQDLRFYLNRVETRERHQPSPLVYDCRTALKMLRGNTAYRMLRQVLDLFMVLNLVCAAIFIIMCFFDSEHLVIYVAACAAAIFGLVPMALGHLVIDIADANLRKS